MLPDNTISVVPLGADFVVPKSAKLIDYERGGIALNDTSAGLNFQLWALRYKAGQVLISAETVAETVLFVQPGITELSLAFDQNMQPVVAYRVGDNSYLRWYDATIPGITTSTFLGCKNPRVSLDDNRPGRSASSDIIFAYVSNRNMYWRAQREHYSIERLLLADVYELRQIGMMQNYRFGFDAVYYKPLNDDAEVVASRNPAGATMNHLDLCPLQAGYAVQLGDATQALKFDAGFSQLGSFQLNAVDVVNVSFALAKTDFNYFMAFWRVWLARPVPFICQLIIDTRPLQDYCCQFVPRTLQNSKPDGLNRVSVQLEVKRNRNSLDDDLLLVQSRN